MIRNLFFGSRWGALLLLSMVLAEASAQTSLLGGQYITRNDVTQELAFAKDCADMREAQTNEDKKKIFTTGKNSLIDDIDGGKSPVALETLSTTSAETMAQDPLYAMFRHAFMDLGTKVENEDIGMFDEKPVGEYGKTIVMDLFNLDEEGIETEAAVVMIIWMAVAHELHEVLRACKNSDVNTKVNILEGLDRAAAFWIGDLQEKGDSETGQLMYNIAEQAGERFGEPNGEVNANTVIINTLNEIQSMADKGLCTSGQETDYVDLRNLVEKIYSHMTIPLVQQMIHHMQQTPNEGADDFVELYALALLPQIAYCDAEAHKVLLGYTVTSKFTSNVRDDVISNLQKAYSCLGITCSDIGSYQNGAVPACEDDPTAIADLAGYSPATDVKQWSYLDRDLSLIKAFMNTRAFEAAKEYYEYGHSASIDGNFISFKQLATSNYRQQVSEFESFSYALGGDNYADQIISDALNRKAPFDNASTDQLTNIVVDSLVSLVSYMAVKERFTRANLECGGEGANNLWDIGAALFIGSGEGLALHGSGNGSFLYGKAKALCESFDNCLLDDAPVNQAIIKALEDGRDSLLNGDCLALRDAVNVIMPALPVPLVQCTLQYATVYDKLSAGTQDGALGTGYACAQSIFPLVDMVDGDAGSAIIKNMEITKPEDKPVPDGPQAVFDAFSRVFAKGNQFPVTCAFVGTNNYDSVNGNICPDLVPPPPTASPPPVAPVAPGTPTLAPVTPKPVTIPPTSSPTYMDINFPTHAPKERYEFTTDVDTIMKIALDVRDMAEAIDIDQTLNIYQEGKNAKDDTVTYTIEGFSTNAAETMKQNRIFSIFRHALADKEIFGGSEKVDTTYADVVVRNAIEVTADAALAAEAAIVLDVWMQVSHYLDEAVRGCEREEDSTPQLDLALALWVGADQDEGLFDSGHLLYNVAQTASQRFGHPERECDVNSELIELFNEAKDITETCPGNADNHIRLRDVVARTYSQMAVPLFQNLIYYILTADDPVSRNLLKLYALSVIPQGAACNPAGYDYLYATLIEGDVTEDQFDKVFMHIEEIMFCLRIDCDDLSIPPTPQFSAAYDFMCAGFVDFDLAFDFAGYIPKTNVNEFLRLDLDILQIGIFVETGANEAATDYYTYGYNSKLSSGNLISLTDLATSSTRTNVPLQYQNFKSYYKNDDYADSFIMDILSKRGVFANATPDQLSALVTSFLQGMVMYMAVLEKLYTAVIDCKVSSEAGGGVRSWDIGAAMFVGSIDAFAPSGGQMIYALGNEMCAEFNTCDNTDRHDRAYVSKRIMEALGNGKNLLDDDQCDGALALITNSIMDILPVPLVQSTLHFAKQNEVLAVGTDSPELGRGYAYASSIVPLASNFNTDDATTIADNMKFDLTAQPVPGGSETVFSAFVDVLPGTGIDCNDVGKHIPDADEETSVCTVEEERPEDPGETPTDLGDGLYTTTTYVQDRANIAMDMVEIMKQLDNGNKEIAQEIYARGGNSDIFNENGVKIGQRSFGNFSTSETLNMKEEEMFALYTYALQDSEGKYNGRDVRLYADSIVKEAFETKALADKTLGGEAALIFNLWMYTVHELYQTLRKCKNRVIADTDGVHSIDEVVAYWIGDGQQTGSQNGHLLYAWAETQGNLFRLEQFGQTRTNSNIIRLFNEAKLELSFPNACVDNPNTYPRLRIIVDKIIAVMTVPIIQGLIHYLRNTDHNRARLYAKAFIPHAASCNLAAYEYLKNKLVVYSWSAIEVDAIVEAIESTYSCLGLTCEDIGDYRYYDRKTCKNEEKIIPLADYTPESYVRPYARLDLDVLSMYISMKRGAYGAAADTYKYGKHAVLDDGKEEQVLSLYQLATSTGWSSVPQFDSFVRYYGSDRYANDIIQRGLAPSLDPHASLEQRGELVVKGSQLLVVQMAVLASMHEALDDCKSVNPERQAGAGAAWDKAAAYLAGSLGHSKHGLMYFALANNRCGQFGTCEEDGKSMAGKKLTTLLYAGRAEINGKACSALSKTIEEIVPVLLVPLIQGTLRYAMALDKGTNVFGASTNADVAEGYIYSRSILPLIEDANRNAAVTIDRNFDWPDATSSVRTNPDEIYDAFGDAYSGLNVDCKMVGETSAFSACEGARNSQGGEGGDKAGMIVGIIVGIIAAVALSVLIWVKRPNSAGGKSSVVVNSEQAQSLVTNEAGLVESGESKIKNPFSKKSEEIKLVRNEAGEFNEDSQMNGNAVEASKVNHDEPLKGDDVEDALV